MGMNMLRSEGHQIYGLHVNKISPLDTKRWIDTEDVKTLAFGHKDLPPNSWTGLCGWYQVEMGVGSDLLVGG